MPVHTRRAFFALDEKKVTVVSLLSTQERKKFRRGRFSKGG